MEAESATIPVIICPTRRKPMSFPVDPGYSNAYNAPLPPTVINKTDYAANGGSVRFLGDGPGPNSNCYVTYPNCDWTDGGTWPDYADANLVAFNGVSGPRSEVNQIPDGQSHVFFAGEKYLDPNVYYTGTDGADNGSCLEGNDWDVNRWVMTGFPPMRDTRTVNPMSSGFGSAHPQGVHFVFCDGSVKMINYQINFATYQSLGVRNDGTYSEDY